MPAAHRLSTFRLAACSTLLVYSAVTAELPRATLPDHQTAKNNAHHIFNAIHSAGRQWGSSVNHNGLSFFPVIVPEGSLLYHGGQSADRPVGPEWLAFEVEHAEIFTFATNETTDDDDAGSARFQTQRPMSHDSKRNRTLLQGHLQIYRANRDLNVLYIDGMGAGKTSMGTLDTQDLVLLENRTIPSRDPFESDRIRAGGICKLLDRWGYDGLMRMEIGFELMYCDFSNGTDLIMQTRTFLDGPPKDETFFFQWARAASERYDGIGGDRVRIDFSSMVSAFFFPVNISNPDPNRPDLPRLAAASLDELKDIKAHLRDVVMQRRRFTVNWQAVADMIVTRYARRLSSLADEKQPLAFFYKELEGVIKAYINATARAGDESARDGQGHNPTSEELRSCQKHYLLPALFYRNSWSAEDKLIHTAISAVTSDICEALFSAYDIVKRGWAGDADDGHKRLNESRAVVAALKKKLSWTVWRRPELCAVDQLLLIAMWPLGDSEDYWQPACRSYRETKHGRVGYWHPS